MGEAAGMTHRPEGKPCPGAPIPRLGRNRLQLLVCHIQILTCLCLPNNFCLAILFFYL